MSKQRKPVFDTEAASSVSLPSQPAFAPPPPPAAPVPALQTSTPNAPAASSAPPSSVASAATTVTPEVPAAGATPSKARPTRRKYRYPDALISSDLADKLRLTALHEKATDPVHARSHGLIVKQAINKHAKDIQAALTPDGASDDEDLLFPEAPESLKRRKYRTGERPERVTLSGMTAKDSAVLDRLAKQWADGNRSALVEAALRLEFGEPEESFDAYSAAE